MLFRFFGLGICLLTPLYPIWAQQDTSVQQLAEAVVIRGEASATNYDTFSLSGGNQALADQLILEPSAVVRFNGASSLASLSIRGGAPEQSTVFWNGLTLQNNTNGVIDLNLMPSYFFDRFAMNGTQSAASGSGSTAGSISAANRDFTMDTTSEVGGGVEQFGRYTLWSTVGYRLKNSYHEVRVFLDSDGNEYAYQPADYVLNKRLDTLQHAGMRNGGLLHQSHFTFKKVNPLNVRFWIQNTDRDIPATLLEASSRKSQHDDAVRIQSDWSNMFWGGLFRINAGYMREGMIYRDADTFQYISQTALTLLNYSQRFGVVHLSADLDGRWMQADGDTFYQNNRSEVSAAIHGRMTLWRFKLSAGIRRAAYTGYVASPILYHAEMRVRCLGIQTALHVNSNYRLPTFNNLFWRPGGDPSLTPERSHRQQLILTKQLKQFLLSAEGYSTLITNQIRWVPTSSGYFAAIQDSDRFWNRGAEWSVRWTQRHSSIQLNANHLRSGSWQKGQQPSTEQQRFVPKLQIGLAAQHQYRSWQGLVQMSYVSDRGFSTNQQSDAYQVINLRIRKDFKHLEGYIKIDNLLGSTYYMLPNRPMPMRVFGAGVTYRFRSLNYPPIPTLIELI